MKTAKATVAAILYTSKTLASGEHPIMIRICYNGKRKYKSTGLSCSVKLWNETKQEVRERHPLAMNMNAIIGAEVNRLKNIVLEFEFQGQPYSPNSIIETAARKQPTRKTLYDLFEERIDYFRYTTKKLNTSTGYQTLLNIIKRFTDNRIIELFDVNEAWLGELEEYLRGRYADTSIKKFFNILKAVMNYACLKDLIETNPFGRFRLSKKLDVHTTKRALSVDEMNCLIGYYLDTYCRIEKKVNLEITNKKYWNSPFFKRRGANKLLSMNAEQFALATFICSYIFQGLALVDLAKLKWKDLVQIQVLNKEKYDRDCAKYGAEYAEQNKEMADFYEINTTRTKTQHPTRILVERSVVKPFLAPFQARVKKQDSDGFIFPIYYNDDPETRFERLSYATHMINLNLQRAAEHIGVTRKITFYSARHTYATMLYHADVPLSLIAQNMGRNASEIETYLKDFDMDKIIKANKQVWESSIKALQMPEKERDL